ncbi:uncharacterized protein ACN427_003181 isoform 1-T1 [Glossina fuscipes fuscipes]
MSIWTTATTGLENALAAIKSQKQTQQQQQQQQQQHSNTCVGDRPTNNFSQSSGQRNLINSSAGSLSSYFNNSSLINSGNNYNSLHNLSVKQKNPSATNGGTSNTSSPSSSTPTHSTSGLHIGAAVGAASALASTIIAHCPNNSSISNCSNNNQNGNNGTYQRHTLTQSQLLSYTPPNPHKRFALRAFLALFGSFAGYAKRFAEC